MVMRSVLHENSSQQDDIPMIHRVRGIQLLIQTRYAGLVPVVGLDILPRGDGELTRTPNFGPRRRRLQITAEYTYQTTDVSVDAATGAVTAKPVDTKFVFETARKVPKTGLMIVGWGGNNGTTVTAGIIANKRGITWKTKLGEQKPDYYGSLTQASTVRLGSAGGRDVYVPFNSVLPMVHPNDLVITGWDISSANLGDAMVRAQVLDYDLQRQMYPIMKEFKPLPSIYYPDFIAANQSDRADNVLTTANNTKSEHVEAIRAQIREFKAANGLDKVLVLWSANTERFSDVAPGLNMTAAEVLASIARNEAEVSPSTVFAVATILEGCTYINGSPQNTFVPGVIELAEQKGA